MKKLIFVFTIMLSAFNGNGQEKNDFNNGTITTTFNKEVIEYRFSSFTDLQEGIDEIIKNLDVNNIENKKTEECKVAIQIKVELLIGINTTSISELLITSCDEATLTEVNKKFKSMLLAIIQS